MQAKWKNFYKKMKFSFKCFADRNKIAKFINVNV